MSCQWDNLSLVRRIEYGRGIARSNGEAKEIAAREAYERLYNELRGPGPLAV